MIKFSVFTDFPGPGQMQLNQAGGGAPGPMVNGMVQPPSGMNNNFAGALSNGPQIRPTGAPNFGGGNGQGQNVGMPQRNMRK